MKIFENNILNNTIINTDNSLVNNQKYILTSISGSINNEIYPQQILVNTVSEFNNKVLINLNDKNIFSKNDILDLNITYTNNNNLHENDIININDEYIKLDIKSYINKPFNKLNSKIYYLNNGLFHPLLKVLKIQ